MSKSDDDFNLFAEVHRLIMTDKNAQAFAKLMNTPLRGIADDMAKQFESLMTTVAFNIHDTEKLRVAVQVFVAQNLIALPMNMIRMIFKQK